MGGRPEVGARLTMPFDRLRTRNNKLRARHHVRRGVGALVMAACVAVPIAPAARAQLALVPGPPVAVPDVPAGSSAGGGPAESTDNAVDRVIAVSVDGLNPEAIDRLGPAQAPNLHRLMREGASTLNGRTAFEQTRTLPNHTGMLTGLRIAEDGDGHGVTFNSDTGTTVHRTADGYASSIFDVVHDHGGSTALFATKTKFDLFQRTWNTSGGDDHVGRNDGTAKIDRFTVDSDHARLVGQVTADLRRSPRTFTFVHLSLPDRVGHDHGFLGAEYLRAVRQTDAQLGQIISTIDAKPSLRDHSLLMVTSDHGGDGAAHSKQTDRANYRVPFLVWGPGVSAGGDLYRLNPHRRDPGSARPPYSGPQPVRSGDLANLATDALDLPAVPGSQFNHRQALEVFR